MATWSVNSPATTAVGKYRAINPPTSAKLS